MIRSSFSSLARRCVGATSQTSAAAHAHFLWCPRVLLNSTSHTTLTLHRVRHKHSARQVKRLFNKHPARLRALKKQHTPQETTTPAPLYKAVFEPTFLPNGWCAPAHVVQQDFCLPDYPFSVTRTQDKPNGAVGFLPVYTNHRKDGTKITTRIRKVTGNVDVFVEELSRQLATKDIRIRTGGSCIEVNGNVAKEIRYWLASLGF